MWKNTLLVAFLACAGMALNAADPGTAPKGPRPEGPPPGGERGDHEGHRRPPPPPPMMMILDTDRDGELSAAEIEAASAALKTLDKNGDGKLDHFELRPPLPPREGGGPDGPPPPPPPRGPRGEGSNPPKRPDGGTKDKF